MSRKADFIFSAVDHYTSPLTTMRDANQRFNKEIEATQTRIRALGQRQDGLASIMGTTQRMFDENSRSLKLLKTQIGNTSSSINELKNSLKSTDLEGGKKLAEQEAQLQKLNKSYEEACAKQETYRATLKSTQSAMRDIATETRKAEQTVSDLKDGISKADNRAGSDGLLKNLAGAGFTKMIGDTFSGMLNAEISSAFGADAGAGISTTLSGIVNGAAMGFAAGGGLPGAVVGGTIGLFTGGLNAATQQSQKEDEYFKSAVQDTITEIENAQAADLEAGIIIASSREKTMLAFTKMLDNDEKRAEDYLGGIHDLANRTPFGYDDLTNISKTLLNYGYTDDPESDYGMLDTITSIVNAGSVKGMDARGMNDVATVLGRMYSRNQVDREDINQLMDRSIPVVDYLCEGFGIAKDEIYDAVSKGLIPGAEAALCIKESMQDAFPDGAEALSETYSGLESTLKGVKDDLIAEKGRGFTEERKQGMIEEINTLNGETGSLMKDAYYKIGQYEAEMVNLKSELEYSAFGILTGAVPDDTRFDLDAIAKLKQLSREYEKSGDESGKLFTQAQAIARAQYNKTAGQQEYENQKEIIEGVRDMLVQDRDYWDAGYKLGQEFSKGMKAASQKGIPDALSYTSIYGINTTPTMGYKNRTAIAAGNIQDGSEMLQSMVSRFTKAATGIDRVPYDNFPALLHQDERVLTAQEARGGRQAPQISININGLTVREEADVYKIANVLANELQKAQLVAINT